MAQDQKVVKLREVQGTGIGQKLPAPLVRLRDASARSLTGILSEFFDSADDVLFGMADRAGSNQDQVAYFDAMRELRLRRKTMSNTMLAWVARAFNEIGQFDPVPRSRSLSEVDQDSLSLLDDTELEKQVAIDSLMNKLSSRYAESLRLLGARIAHVSGQRELAERQMPLSPEVICTGLGHASEDLDIDIRARLVVIKLFDGLLVDRLAALYQEANRLLIEQGVLPDLKHVPASPAAGQAVTSRPVPPPAAASTDAPDSLPSEGGSGVTFSELTELLHRNGSTGSASTPAALPELATDDLMQRLGSLQSSVLASDHGQTLPLSVLLGRALAQGPDQRLPVNQVDGDVINLVAMLFEFILDDRQLPARMKLLIGRLQIPVLKVALLDRSFFNRGGHPARKLLNELAMAGIGWAPRGENQRDPLREKVESVVERLLNDFTDNVELFDELLKEFQHFMDLDRRRRELVEQRLRDVEEGRARHEVARDRVQVLLDSLLDGRDLPGSATSLINEPWRKYLEWVCLRKGESSDDWQAAAELTERLAWSLDPDPVDDSTRDRLLKAIPGITDALRSGLHEISWDPFAIDSALRDLELAHVDVLQGVSLRRQSEKQTEAVPASLTDELDMPVMEAGDAIAEPEVIAAPMLSATVAEPAAVDVTASPEVAAQPVSPQPVAATAEPAEPEPAAVKAGTEAEIAQPGEHWLEQAAGLRVGCWVEMPRDGGRLRCKLAAIIRATGKYIFVNRNGTKVAEFQQPELAMALSDGRVILLDDGLIFDRALESIIDNLRHNRRD